MKIKEISKKIDNQILILFWQFTLRTISELDIVSNQNLSIEMFLIRLIHINSIKDENKDSVDKNTTNFVEKKNIVSDFKRESINQIKNVTQEKKITKETETEIKADGKISINSLEQLLEICVQNKEIKLKYELEKNVYLVSFEKNRIELSFNDKLDKNFVKDLSLKLYEWTGERWIITFSKNKGEISIKEKEKNKKEQKIIKTKESALYKKILETFPDANLVDVISKDERKNDRF